MRLESAVVVARMSGHRRRMVAAAGWGSWAAGQAATADMAGVLAQAVHRCPAPQQTALLRTLAQEVDWHRTTSCGRYCRLQLLTKDEAGPVEGSV